ncbi:MAG: CbiQ family ECF transporter T component, partial [Planctomycetota bacterium]
MPETGFSLDPRLRVLYLLAVAVGIFFMPEPWQVALVFALQVVLWFALGMTPRRLLRQILKLWGFVLLIFITYSLTSLDPTRDEWVEVSWLWGLRVNLVGAEMGGIMVLRIVTVVLASQVTRAGDPRAIAAGLRKLGVPKTASVSIDTVLALFGDTGRRKGGGGGGG